MIYYDPQAKQALQARPVPWFVFLFLAAAFFLCQHGLFTSVNMPEGSIPSEDYVVARIANGSLSRLIGFLALGLFSVVSLNRNRGVRFRLNGLLGQVMLFFAGWTLLSIVWADDPSLTFKRQVVFAILSLSSVATARRFYFREIVSWTLFTTGLYLLIGVSTEIALGTFSPFKPGYRFAGTLLPNDQGINCALLVLSGVAAADTTRSRQTLFRACAVFGLVFLVLTASRTALGALLLAVGVYITSVASRRANIFGALAIFATSIVLWVPIALIGGTSPPDLKSTALLGRDTSTAASFSGRTEVWEEVEYYIHQHPILGLGYGDFWTPARTSIISDEVKWGVPNSHSAYFDYFLTLGAVGLAAYVLSLLLAIRLAFRLQKLSQNSGFAFCGALLVFCSLDGLLESNVAEGSLLMFLSLVVLIKLGFGAYFAPDQGARQVRHSI